MRSQPPENGRSERLPESAVAPEARRWRGYIWVPEDMSKHRLPYKPFSELSEDEVIQLGVGREHFVQGSDRSSRVRAALAFNTAGRALKEEEEKTTFRHARLLLLPALERLVTVDDEPPEGSAPIERMPGIHAGPEILKAIKQAIESKKAQIAAAQESSPPPEAG